MQRQLTKANFFDEMNFKFPKAMKIFCNWIDDYKKSVNWNDVFGEHLKFHDLPFDLQCGVWYRFMIEQGEAPEIDLRNGIQLWLYDKDFQNI